MLEALRKLKEKVNSFDAELLAIEILKDNETEVADKVREQLERGEDGNGELLQPEYLNPQYARMKNRMNFLPGLGVPDLKLTGSFHEKIKAKVGGDGIEIESSDSKSKKLQKKYGAKVLKVSEQSAGEINEETLKPKMMQGTKEQLL